VFSLWSQQRCCVALGLFFALLYPPFASAQIPKSVVSPQAAQTEPAETPQDPLGRTTPRGTVMGFLTAAYNQKWDAAAQYLDTRLTGKDADDLAFRLFYVLDRRLPATLNSISNEPLGSLTNRADASRELIGSVVTEDDGVDIYLERIERLNSVPIWLFSRETLADIPDVYDEINTVNSVDKVIPDAMLKRYFGLTLFGWSFIFVFLPLEYLALSLISRLVGAGSGYAIRRWAHRPEMRNPTILPHPLRLFFLYVTIKATLHGGVSLSLLARQAASITATLLLIVAGVWSMFLIDARCELYFKKRMELRGNLGATAVLRPARRTMDLLAIIVGIAFLLHALGINPTATLAGLGVGGLAIALAAQKTLENVIGGASLIADGVIRVGDFLKVGDIAGTVEVIGLRSTRVRTMDRTIVTIPNGQMATLTLENLSARDRFWFRHVIGVELETSQAALDSILAQIRNLLERDTRVVALSSRVRFLRFIESGLEIEVFAYITARDWGQFLEIQEDLLIKIRQLSASIGVEFAYPSRSIYLKNNTEAVGMQPQSLVRNSNEEEGHEIRSR